MGLAGDVYQGEETPVREIREGAFSPLRLDDVGGSTGRNFGGEQEKGKFFAWLPP